MPKPSHLTRSTLFGLTSIAVFVITCVAAWYYLTSFGLGHEPIPPIQVAREMVAAIFIMAGVFEAGLYFLYIFVARQDNVIATQEAKLQHYSQRLEELVSDQYDRLKKISARFEAVTSNAPVMLVALDNNGRILFAEGGGFLEAGLRGSDLVGHLVSEIITDQAGIERLKDALSGHAVASKERLGRADFIVHFLPAKENGSVGGVLMVALKDLPEKKKK